MAREIKFRIPHFNSRTNKFSHFSYWGRINHKGNPCTDCFTSPSTSSSTYSEPDEQFTGLKDKNGVEIYEGDILKESEDGIFEVVWDSKYCKYKLDCSRVCKYTQYPEWNRGVQMQIIGNIHQHPHLISETPITDLLQP